MKLKGNTILWMYAVAILLWLGSTSGRSLTLEDDNMFLKQYPTVRFTTDGATAESYSTFIDQVRNNLSSEVPADNRTHGIPMLRNSSQVPINQRYVLVELTNHEGQTVTLGVDVTNVYLVGYRVGNYAYFFPNQTEASENLFTDAPNRHTLNLPFTYLGLETAANASRGEIPLGMGPLDNAIRNLFYYTTGQTQRPALARSFIICAQMISEAIRFRYIEYQMRVRIRNSIALEPNPAITSLENNWGGISTAIESSGRGGAFGSIQLQRPNGSEYNLDNVHRVIGAIALLVYRCAPRSSSQFSLLIRQVGQYLNDDVCVDYEPTVRIIGLNGLCVDVTKDRYEDGNPINLWTCKSNSDRNQLWTLKKDGTIQSNGKCLIACSDIPRSYLMIYNCSKATADFTRWQVWDDGTIINPKSGLVLSSTSASQGTTLTVEANIHTTNQAWLPSNNTQPIVTSIVGLNDFCLTYSDLHYYKFCDKYRGNVSIEECASKKAEQQWAIYADGSIRPQKNLDYCLTSDANVEGGIVRILSCRLGSPGQRWVFKSDGTIWDLYYNMVLDVKDSDPSLKQIIIWSFNGNPNQKWLRLP